MQVVIHTPEGDESFDLPADRELAAGMRGPVLARLMESAALLMHDQRVGAVILEVSDSEPGGAPTDTRAGG